MISFKQKQVTYLNPTTIDETKQIQQNKNNKSSVTYKTQQPTTSKQTTISRPKSSDCCFVTTNPPN